MGITFTDAAAWAGHGTRVQLTSDVGDNLTDADWRMAWVDFGPDVIDSETPVSAFGRVEVTLGSLSRLTSDAGNESEIGQMNSLVKIIATALSYEFAISRLDRAEPGG